MLVSLMGSRAGRWGPGGAAGAGWTGLHRGERRDDRRDSAGTIGFDGLFVIKPDGRIYIQSGIGNSGTESVIDVHRVVAEMLGVPWEKCEVTWGNTAKPAVELPIGRSQTIHAMTRAAHAVATDARKKLQEIAAMDLGGKPEDYDVAGERVSEKAAERA